MRSMLVAALIVALGSAACGEGQDEPDRVSRPSSTATLRIVEPEAGASMVGPSVFVRVELTGGQVVPRSSRELAPDKGHVHLRLNGKLVSQSYGTEQELTDLQPGEYLLEAEFVAADHGPFNPRVTTSTSFTVR